MRSTAFLFSSGRRERLDNGGPTEFLYGYAELAKAGKPVAMFEETDLGSGAHWPRIPEAISARIAAVFGISPRLVSRLRAAIAGPLADYDVLVATTQSIGMAIAALRVMGQHDKRLILMTMGLLPHGSAKWKQALYRRVLDGVELAVLSKPEAASLRSWSQNRFIVRDFTFGVDLDFWSAGPAAATGEVLSIGNDPARDFDTLVAAWQPDFPMLRIITRRPVVTSKPNITIERGDWRQSAITDEEIRDRFRGAQLVITPVTDTIQPSGQSATLQAMACGRPVIMSNNRGLWDRDFMRDGLCRLVPPGDPEALSRAIRTMLDSPDDAEAMGQAASRFIVGEDISSSAMADQIERLAT